MKNSNRFCSFKSNSSLFSLLASIVVTFSLIYSTSSLAGYRSEATARTFSIDKTEVAGNSLTPRQQSAVISQDRVRFGMNMVHFKPELFMDIGVQFHNHKEVWWNHVQKNKPKHRNDYDWSILDKKIKEDQQAGFLSWLTVHSASSWASDQQKVKLFKNTHGKVHPPLQPQYYDEFEHFITQMVERYDGDGVRDMPGLRFSVNYYQLGQEYAQPGVWWSGSEKEYLEEWKVFVRAARAASKEVKIIANGIASAMHIRKVVDRQFRFSPVLARGYIEKNSGQSIEGYKKKKSSLNQYGKKLAAVTSFITMVRNHPELYDIDDIRFYTYTKYEKGRIKDELTFLKKLHLHNGGEKPIFIGEGQGAHLFVSRFKPDGPPDTSTLLKVLKEDAGERLDSQVRTFEAQSASEMVKIHAQLFAHGADAFAWFTAYDYLNVPERYARGHHWQANALVKVLSGYRVSYKKPSYYTYGLLTEKIGDFTHAEPLSEGPLYVYKFSKKSSLNSTHKAVYIVWRETVGVADLSLYLSGSQVRVSPIITELDSYKEPIRKQEIRYPVTSVPLSDIPVIIEQ